MGLVEGYESIQLPLAEPKLRAGLEQDLKRICVGERDAKEVLAEQVRIYRDAFKIITEKANLLDESMATRLEAGPVNRALADAPMTAAAAAAPHVFNCPKCSEHCSTVLKFINEMFVLSCTGYPDCRNSYWLPSSVIRSVSVLDVDCPNCGPGYKKLKIVLKSIRHVTMLNQRYVNHDDDGLISYCSCIFCDRNLQDLCDISIMRPSAQLQTNNNSNRRPPAPPAPPAVRMAAPAMPPPRPTPQPRPVAAPRPATAAPRPAARAAPPPSANNSPEVRCSVCNKLARRFCRFCLLNMGYFM